ncbi:DNA processing/uptake protein [Spiroplasma clarkii]|nr:DNA processing/uptake protein [Spiroplasma clarkii]
MYLTLKYEGQWDDIYQALLNKERVTVSELHRAITKVTCNYITILSPYYPNCFKSTNKPPFVIFYQGEISLLNSNKQIIGIVGGKNVDLATQEKVVKLIS